MVAKEAAGGQSQSRKRKGQARRKQIIDAARRIAEQEGWPSVTVRRLADEISYSQPVLYSHFESRESILTAVALEGFQELGFALEKAKKGGKQTDAIHAAAHAYLEFARSWPAVYEAMFSLSLTIPFGEAATPTELRFAFAQILELFQELSATPEIQAELFWAALHGIAELTRTNRLPRRRQKERVRSLIELFTSPR